MWKPLRQHFDWSNRIPTPFLSTWDSDQKALETAIGREERGCQNVRIAVIEVDILEEEDIWFARLTDLVERFNVFLPERTRMYLSSREYLCLRRIPSRAVIEVMDRQHFEDYCEGT